MSRPTTPDRKNPDGTTTITVQRACNGCGRTLGDATTVELDCAYMGLPLPDVTAECGCTQPPSAPEQPALSVDPVIWAGHGSLLCPECGYLPDTPNHELGCIAGREA